MKTLLLLFTLTIGAHRCHKDIEKSIPACIQAKIDEIKNQNVWNPPAEVHEYSYQGKRVFYFTSNCCDQYNVVYDEECHYLCAPSGGITGRGDNKCPDFNSTAHEVRLVWKDPRK